MSDLGLLNTASQTSHPWKVWMNRKSRVLAIGDSHTWLMGPWRYRGWDVDALPGRPTGVWAEGDLPGAPEGGVAVLDRRLRPRHKIVVFDLATNDWDETVGSGAAYTTSNLNEVWSMIGNRKLLLVTAWARDTNVNAQAELLEVNAAIQAFARGKKRARVLYWNRVLKRRPGLFSSDGIHLTPKGYDLRKQAVRSAVRRYF